VYFPISDWFGAFVLTLAIETPIVAILFRRTEPNLLRLVVLIVFANLATHLAVWYVISQVLLVGTFGYTAVAESWAMAAEAVFYKAAIPALSWRRAVAVSVAANAASAIVGRVIGAAWLEGFR
jgi:hypothetical protein